LLVGMIGIGGAAADMQGPITFETYSPGPIINYIA
jgi:hypothetical protein